MKILFLSQIVPYPPHGGVLQRGYNILRELAKVNDVHLLAFIHSDILSTEGLKKEAIKELESFCKSVEFVQFKAKTSKLHFYSCLLASLFSTRPFSVIVHKSEEFRNKLQQILKKQEFDLIHYDTIALAQYFQKNTKAVKTLTHHNIESELMLRRAKAVTNILEKMYFQYNGIKLARYERIHVTKYDCNITCSKIDSDKLQSWASTSNIEVVPNGVDTNYYRPNYEVTRQNTIVHVGALQSANLDGMEYYLKEIWPLIKQNNPGVRFVIVGGGELNRIRRIANDDRDIILTGYVEDIRPIVWKADVLVVPLRFGGGTKLKVLDAMAMGKAIVTTSIGSEGIEVIPGTHLLVADSKEEFSADVTILLNNEDLRRAMERAARQLVLDKYDWSLIGEKQNRIFMQCISRVR